MLGIFSSIGIGVLWWFLIFSALIAVLIFEILMLIHVLSNPFINSQKKIIWAVGMVLIHPFVAIAYYFTDFKLK